MNTLRNCRDCDRPISKRAKVCPHCGRPVGRGLLGLAGFAARVLVLAVLAMLGLLYALGQIVGPAGAAPGSRAVLELPGGEGVWLAADEASYNAMLDAQNAHSPEQMARLLEGGKVVRELNGTEVVVVRDAVLSRLVRVTRGGNPGFEGWVQREFVRAP